MTNLTVAALLVVLCTAMPACAAVDTASLMRDLHDMGTLPILTDTYCRQFSSHNKQGPSHQIGSRTYYEANVDRGHFLSLSEDGKAMLAEMEGPGAIVRIWSARPDGYLKIYLDDAPEPVISMLFKDFFTDPELHPLRTTSSGGWISYYPIPYAKSCKVVVEDPGPLFYHVTYQTYPPTAQVKTYTNQLDAAAREELATLLSVWRNPAEFRRTTRPHALGPVKRWLETENQFIVASGKTAEVFSAEGAGCIDEFAVSVDSSDPVQLRQTVIRMFWDGEDNPSVESPLSDFFGNGIAATEYASLPLGVSPDKFYCRFPMPYATSAKIKIENGSNKPLDIQVSTNGRVLDSLAKSVGRFHAKWRQAITEERKLYLIQEGEGRGKFVGCSMTMQGHLPNPASPNTTGYRYLEGDELIWVDGEDDASFRGTGAEDYFNCGWYFNTGPVAQPLHGCPLKDDRIFATGLYRLHVPDYVNYKKDILVEIEHGGHPVFGNYPGAEYSSVTYFYNHEPHKEFFQMPPASELWTPRVPAVESVLRAMEAQDLEARARNGYVNLLLWEKISRGMRGGSVVVLTPEGKGATLCVPFDIGFRDRYVVSAQLAQGKGFAKVDALLDGRPLGSAPDLSSEGEPTPSEAIILGEVVLDPGGHLLELGSVESAKIGLDRLSLTSASSFIGKWNVIGPFENPEDTGLGIPYPPEKEEFNASASYPVREDRQETWRQVDTDSFVDLTKLMQPNQRGVAYAMTHIISPDERTTELLLGAENRVQVWLNGEEIWKHAELRRGVNADQDRVKVTLKPGTNTLLLKLAHSRGGWGFIARLRDPDGELSYSAEKP